MSTRGIKRLFDAALSGVGLLVSAPLWCVIPIAIKIEDGGPVYFPQERVGLDGRVFLALKFRPMCPDAETLTGPVQAAADGARTAVRRRTRHNNSRASGCASSVQPTCLPILTGVELLSGNPRIQETNLWRD